MQEKFMPNVYTRKICIHCTRKENSPMNWTRPVTLQTAPYLTASPQAIESENIRHGEFCLCILFGSKNQSSKAYFEYLMWYFSFCSNYASILI